jgi:pimeloyl-ACP methyl ester carboxylesterase
MRACVRANRVAFPASFVPLRSSVREKPLSLRLRTIWGQATTFKDYVDQVVEHSLAACLESETPCEKLVLVGASMGGMLVLKAAERIHEALLAPPQAPAVRLAAVVLVCSAVPSDCAEGAGAPAHEQFPALVPWSNSSFESTRDSIPDGDEEIWKYALPRWRDESGAVLNEMLRAPGIALTTAETALLASGPRILSVIPGADDTISPCQQAALSSKLRATQLEYPGMSHVGPLLSTRAPQVARMPPPACSLSPAPYPPVG